MWHCALAAKLKTPPRLTMVGRMYTGAGAYSAAWGQPVSHVLVVPGAKSTAASSTSGLRNRSDPLGLLRPDRAVGIPSRVICIFTGIPSFTVGRGDKALSWTLVADSACLG